MLFCVRAAFAQTPVSDTVYATVCDSIVWHGNTYRASGIYTFDTTIAPGLNRTITLNLTVYHRSEQHEYDTIMYYESFLWNGDILHNGGTYRRTHTDMHGCNSVEILHLHVVPKMITNINLPNICSGAQEIIDFGFTYANNVVVQYGETTLGHVDTVFLPDGEPCGELGCSYVSPVEFNDFAEDATITSANDILYVRLNMEHSFLGDLYINITCPNGQKADLLHFSDGGTSQCTDNIGEEHRGWNNNYSNLSRGTNLGNPVNGGDYSYPCDASRTANRPGVGWDYCWSSNTQEGYSYAPYDGLIYRRPNISGASVTPSDVENRSNFYHPEDSFANLIGCPLNGVWQIEVIDGWRGDNGYIFNWDIALDPRRLPQSGEESCQPAEYEMIGDFVTRINSTSFLLEAPDNLTHDTAITYTFRVTNTCGDQIDTTGTIIIHKAYYDTVIDSVASCSSYWWNNQLMTTDTLAYAMLQSQYGCDSLAALAFTLLPSFTTDLYDTVCSNQSYLWGTPQRELFNPSSVTIHTHATDSAGEYYTAGETRLFTNTLRARNNCDSLLKLHLFILPAYDINYHDTICVSHLAGFTRDSSSLWVANYYTYRGDVYYSAGDYRYNYTTHQALACDSIHTLHLKVQKTYDLHIYDTIYDGDTYLFERRKYNATGVYPRLLTSHYMCDSLRTLHLKLNRRTYIDSVICQNSLPLKWYGSVLFNDGGGLRIGSMQIFKDSIFLTDYQGGDSLLVMTLIVRDTSETVDVVHACDSMIWRNTPDTLYRASTTDPELRLQQLAELDTTGLGVMLPAAHLAPYTIHLIPFNLQCDSVHHLNLTLDHTHYFTEQVTACDSLLWPNNPYSTSKPQWYYSSINGIAGPLGSNSATGPVDTMVTVGGCDSVVSLDLTIHYSAYTALRDTICHGVPYSWHGIEVQSDNTYLTEDFPLQDILATIHNCDSVVNITITKMARPQISFDYETDCIRLQYTLHATATAPLTPDGTPEPMAYTLWSSDPLDNSLDGQEGQTTIQVAPNTTTEYILFADYSDIPFCPATANISLRPVTIPKSMMKVIPDVLTYDIQEFTAYDISPDNGLSRSWYTDWQLHKESGPTMHDIADISHDSLIVALVVDNGLCMDTAVKTIPIMRVAVFAPNIFTPQQETNNRFNIATQGVIDGELCIYNREGLLVYRTSNLSEGWDGRNLRGIPCPQDNYVWKFEYTTTDHPRSRQSAVGSVLLIR